ncbi:MAG: nickel pincer cofactor biosynthesis protein LarC [Acidimicrobiia bacterium]|nr:nickel pincer cofactor biosynthesis protein LarC [Acidimicrobiia bacterium]
MDTRLAWFHCFSGIAGDMAMGSLLDAGADVDEVRKMLERLPIAGWELTAEPVLRCGLAGVKARVGAEETSTHRTAGHIMEMIEEAGLPDRVTRRSMAVFGALAEVEGRLHQRPASEVHFHEVGALDSIIDVVGTCVALEVLAIDEVWCSSIATGRGTVEAAHGTIPVPAPATVGLLVGAPTHGIDVPFELTTPTGAALMAATITGWGPMPSMVVESMGFGAGDRDLDGRPNLTQVVVGTSAEPTEKGQPVTLLEVNVDDATGETLAHTIAGCLAAGAHDAWVTPIVMKKGRPAHLVSALCDPVLTSEVAAVLTGETGSLGVRGSTIERWPVARTMEQVEVDGMAVGVKVAVGRVKVEHDDAVRAAKALGIPLRDVVSLAEEAWRHRLAADSQAGRLPPASDADSA